MSYKSKSKYVRFACDIETSSEYHIDNKPSAETEKNAYKIWDEKRLNCKAWIYLYCALEGDKYLLEIKFENWLSKIINRVKRRVKTHKINLFFHNLKYDGSFLLYELYKIGYSFVEAKKLDKKEKFATALIDSKKSIYQIKFWYNEYFFKVQCSYNLMRCGIAEILTGSNEKPLKIEYLPNIKYEKLIDIPRETINYIKQDCYAITIIWKIIRKIKLDSYKVKTQLSIGAWGKDAAYWAFYRSKWYYENKKKLKKYQWNFKKDEKLFLELRQSYHGGLTGLNKNFIQNNIIDVCGKIITYDINSAYPYVMINEVPYNKPISKPNKNPYLLKIKIIKINNVNVLEKHWLLRYFFYLKIEVVFIWNFEWELLKKLINLEYQIIKTYYFFWTPFYAPFINKMNALKENYSLALNNAKNEQEKSKYRLLRRTIKLLMNSPYGKEAQKEYENIIIDKNYEWKITPSKKKLKYTNISSASFITAKTRSMILEILVKYPDNILYFDTDCVHVYFDKNLTQEQFEKEINIDETKLGSWKKETECVRAKYLKKKCYALMKENGEIISKTAGYNFENFSWEKFFRGNELENISLFSFRNKWQQILLTKINKKL